jgi:ADP-ribose pyrophosphatase YjhB (NUDIX family)
MLQMYKVFINDNPLFFCEDKSQLNDYLNVNYFNYKTDFSFKTEIYLLLSKKNTICCILSDNVENCLVSFFDEYVKIGAAGGVVENVNQQLLFIYRNGVWDLPKGKIEINEDKKDAALREVEEECGLNGPTIKNDLITTYHTYNRDEKKHLKKTYWYAMTYEKEHVLIPQLEEGITKVEWVNKSDLKIYMDKTYGTIKSVISDFLIKD